MTQNLVKKVKVAVYGSLRKGLHNHSLINGETFLGMFESDAIYSLVDLGSFPGLLKDGNTSIVMEVYEVDAEKLRRLDQLEGYVGPGEKNHYNREKIITPFGEVYGYFYNNSSDLIKSMIIEGGDWTDYYRTKSVRNAVQNA